jgi:hypothetical protein
MSLRVSSEPMEDAAALAGGSGAAPYLAAMVMVTVSE